MKAEEWIVGSIVFLGLLLVIYGLVTDLGSAGPYINGPADLDKLIMICLAGLGASMIVCVACLSLIRERKDGND